LPGHKTAAFDLGPQLLYARRRGENLERTGIRIVALLDRLTGSHAQFMAFVTGEPSEESLLVDHPIGRIGAPGELTPEFPPTGYAIAGGMRELAFRFLSLQRDRIDFRDHTIAERLQHTDSGWKIHLRSLRDGSTSTISATALVLTAPVPQALDLLDACSIRLPDELVARLRDIKYTRCLALYGMFTGAGPLPSGGAWFGEGPFEWIVDNAAKGVSDTPGAFTALTSNEWATEHWMLTDAQVVERLLASLIPWCGTPLPDVPLSVLRWKWASPINPLQTPSVLVRDLALVLAGDGFACAAPDPADAALHSGEAAAGRVAGLLTAIARADNRMTSARPDRFILEITVSTPDEARQAQLGGADRLELSSALEVGGITPSLGTFHAVRSRVELPVYVLLRPRPGGFLYSDSEFEAMLRDAEEFMSAGADGLVFGILTADGGIDRLRCAKLVQIAEGHAVFHRAFDFLPDPLLALDELIELGFERVLTSGAGITAEAGATRLSALVQHAGWQLDILPAGTIRPENAADLVRETRCNQIHSSARGLVPEPLLINNPRLAGGMGTDNAGMRFSTDVELVRSLRSELDRLAASLSSSS
jgi:copper homeostasis protein